MKTNDLVRIPCYLFVLMLISIFSFYSCNKIDTGNDNEDVIERFFELPENATPALKRIVADLKTKNEKYPFVEQFVKKEGYPLWKYAEFPATKNSPTLNTNAEEGSDTLINVPVVPQNAKYVKDVLSIKLDADILYKLFNGDDYASYGFDKDPGRSSPNADDVVAKIMNFEKNIWSQETFQVTDNRLFDYWGPGVIKPNSFYVGARFITYVIVISQVCDYTTGGQLESCPPGVDHCFELVPVYCTYSWMVSTWEEDADGTGWNNIPAGGGSSGGSGSSTEPGNPQNPSSCDNGRGWVRITMDNTGQWKNPCTGEPVPQNPNPCNMTVAQAQNLLSDCSGEALTNLHFTNGPITTDANGVERIAREVDWEYYKYTFFTGYTVVWHVYYTGIIYRNNPTDPWKWESIQKSREGRTGIFPTCFDMTMSPIVGIPVISADRQNATLSLSATGIVSLSCLNGHEITTISITPPLVMTANAAP